MSFDEAVRAIIEGDLAALREELGRDPSLVHARSPSEHRAMLVHYLAANGVEDHLQRSPPNAAEVAQVLLESGADPNATCDAYGGSNVLGLLLSSSHPAEAGVQEALVEILCRAGAAVEGPDDDGAPLWTAVTWGYTSAARRLVRCGARVDNVVSAAVVGSCDEVARFFDADGKLLPVTSLRGAEHFSHRRPYDLGRLLEYALVYAASHGRIEIVEWLLSKGPDLSVREPVYGGTALGMARHRHPAAGRPNGSPEVAAILLAAMNQ